MAPVALATKASDFNGLTAPITTIEELAASVDRVSPTAEMQAREPITGSFGVNFASIERGIDEVFDRIERLGDELAEGGGATRFAEWLVIAGGACAAFEYARARYREGGLWQMGSGGPIPYEPKLRRHWFRPRSSR
jgi:hypothetical protein